MTEEEKLSYIQHLDDTLLKGGVILSEWSTYMIEDADVAFVKGAYISTIITVSAAIETHLRFENSAPTIKSQGGFYQQIENTPMPDDIRKQLHELRRFRNRWTHVNDPWDEKRLFEESEAVDDELEAMAKKAIRLLRESLYLNQFI